jgi:hypothetical protein
LVQTTIHDCIMGDAIAAWPRRSTPSTALNSRMVSKQYRPGQPEYGQPADGTHSPERAAISALSSFRVRAEVISPSARSRHRFELCPIADPANGTSRSLRKRTGIHTGIAPDVFHYRLGSWGALPIRAHFDVTPFSVPLDSGRSRNHNQMCRLCGHQVQPVSDRILGKDEK